MNPSTQKQLESIREKGRLMVSSEGGKEKLRVILGRHGAYSILNLDPVNFQEVETSIDEWIKANATAEPPVEPEPEQVLCVPVSHLTPPLFDLKQRFTPFRSGLVGRILEESRFLPRAKAEEDVTEKQLIIYAVVVKGDEVLLYTRGKSGSEDRLHNQRSIGVGGHINPSDVVGGDTIYTALMRELTEELGEQISIQKAELLGFINDDGNPVGQVHLGLAWLIRIAEDSVIDLEHCLNDAEWVKPGAIELPSLETWSAIVLDQVMIELSQGSDLTGGTPPATGLTAEKEDELVAQGYEAARAAHVAGEKFTYTGPDGSPEAALFARGVQNFRNTLTHDGSDGPTPSSGNPNLDKAIMDNPEAFGGSAPKK